MRRIRQIWHDDTAWAADRRTRNAVGVFVILFVLACLLWGIVGLAAPPRQPDSRPSALSLGAAPAEARWFFTCSTDRHRHRHFLKGKTHIWKDIVVLRRDGKRYVRGTWITFDWGLERVTASDRRTYGPC